METKDPDIFESPALELKSKPNELDIKSWSHNSLTAA